MTKLKILACPANQGGCAYYRIIAPYNKLHELHSDDVEIRIDENPLGLDPKTGQWIQDWDFENMKWADIVVTNNLSNYGPNYTARIVGKAKEFGKFVHYDTDDLLTDLYEGHRLYGVYKERKLDDLTKFIYNNADLVSVTQNKFAKRVASYIGDGNTLAVIKNAIDYNLPCWRMEKVEKPKKNFTRFGWAGGIHHEEDVKHFGGVPHFVNQRLGVQNCRWDLYGHPPPGQPESEAWQLDVWKNYKNIIMGNTKGIKNWNIHHALSADRYGQFYSNMDIALAPLEPNEFNDSKSEIKVAECGRYAVPLVASNVGCYDEWIVDGETGFLIDPRKGKTEWVRVLTKLGKNPGLVKRMGENLKSITDEAFDLNKVVKLRLELYRECMSIEAKS